ncbi:MAG: glycoside hydrolase family 20 zincin-like fold domain-containing protein [Armatimonadota bacterium]
MTTPGSHLHAPMLLAAIVVFLLLAPLALAVGNAATSADDPASLLWPQPREVQQAADSPIRLPIEIAAPPELAAPAALLQRELQELFGPAAVARRGHTLMRLALAPEELTRPEEYALSPDAGGVLLRSHDEQGAFWAVHTLATLLEQARPAGDDYTAAIPAIRDWPDSQFRSLMFQGAWVSNLDDYKRTLELMARMRITYFALEFGPQVVLDFDPSIAEGGRFSKADARAVIEYGRSLGLKPIAYLNMLGHLDRAYKKDPYTQHGGIDIRNDETYDQFVYPILEEMLQVYGPVEYFHCGMDEAWELFRWLSEERYDVTSLITRHIERVNDFLKARGVKLVIWHDMLIAPTLEQQLGGPAGPANGGPPQNTADALTRIPKDVVLDYWFYDPLPAYPALDYLRSQGFEVWASPWETPFSFVRYALARQAPTLGTMWSGPPECFGDPRSSTVIAFYAQAAWNPGAAGPEVEPEPALRPAAQQATNAVLWRRRSLTTPGEKALLLSPEGPRSASAGDQVFYGVPLAAGKPVPIEPLPESAKPLTAPGEAARVRLPGGVEVALDGVNTERARRQMILYAAPQERTGTNDYGSEAPVGPGGQVIEVYAGSGDHAVPPGGFVLSAHGGWGRGKSAQLRALRSGDRVSVLDAQGRWIGGSEPIALLAELPGGNVLPINGEDRTREAGQLVLYHPGYGEGHTLTDAAGVELVVRDGRVAAVNDGAGDTAIPADGYVLSAARDGGTQTAALAALHQGDAIRLLIEKAGQRQYLDEALAERSKRFPLGARCTALYLAVSSDRRTSPGALLGQWLVRYDDGTAEAIPCRYGREALSLEPDALPIALSDSVWMVDRAEQRFLVTEWRNPHPEKQVSEIVFVPAQAVLEVGARVVAATASAE